jgi:putative hydrolase of the HAD superfamily
MPIPGLPAVRAVFLDAGNTLLRMDYAAIAGRLTSHGVAVTPEAVEAAEWRARVRLDTEVLVRAGTSTESQDTGTRYLRFVLDGVGVRDERIVRAVAEWRRAYNPPVGLWTAADPQAEPALRLLRGAGVTAAVISNSDGSVRAILDHLRLTRYLDFVLDSSEVGVEKPSTRIFELALERAGLTAAEAAYVGDLYSVDVVGARAAGLRAVLLDPGRCWGARDCPAAPDVLAAVRLLLDGGGLS